MRSLTRQVMHHAAVKFTKTGLPWARSSATRFGLNGSDGTPPAAGLERADDELVATPWRRAIATTTISAAAVVAAQRHEPLAPRVTRWSHAAKAMSTRPERTAATPRGPA